MTIFEESRGQPWHAISVEEVAYLRMVLGVHANDPADGKCRVCDLAGCQDWRYAYDHMAAAGELMTEPDRWLRGASAEVRR